MSSRQTKFPKDKVPARSVHQAVQVIGKNGLPVDALASLEPGKVLIGATTTELSYNEPTVTVDSSIDLSPIINFSDASFTGKIILSTASRQQEQYFIDPNSIDNSSKTFAIYKDPKFTTSPSSIDTSAGWFISEAALVNRLQTTTTAVIDNVEFRDVEVRIDGTIDSNVQIDSRDGDSSLSVGTEDGTFEGEQHVLRTDGFGRLFVRRYGPDILFQLLTNAKFLELANYDKIVPIFSGDDVTLQYFESEALIREAIFTFTSEIDWSVELKSYLNDDNGDRLLDDDGSLLLLE